MWPTAADAVEVDCPASPAALTHGRRGEEGGGGGRGGGGGSRGHGGRGGVRVGGGGRGVVKGRGRGGDGNRVVRWGGVGAAILSLLLLLQEGKVLASAPKELEGISGGNRPGEGMCGGANVPAKT